MRVDACDRHRSGQQSDRLFDLRVACLDRHLDRALLAMLRLLTRDYALAREHAEEAVALAEAEFPDGHLRTFALGLRGVARIGVGETEQGIADARTALALEEGRLSPDHEDVGHARWWLGTALMRAGLIAEAIAELEDQAATVLPITAYRPSAASTSASPANTESSVAT